MKDLTTPAAVSTGEDDFDFQTWPFYWLTRANGSYLQKMELALKTIDIDIPRWRVLMVLHKTGCSSVSEIADHAIMKLPTMTKIVRRMQADGLVVCRQRDTDARVTEVILSEAGKVAGAKAWAIAGRTYRRAFSQMTARQIATLNRLLAQVCDNLGPAGE